MRNAGLESARDILDAIAHSQADAIEAASRLCADAIGGGGLVHLFGTGHRGSRSRRCSRVTARTRASTRSSSSR